jgi:hypothetical protein
MAQPSIDAPDYVPAITVRSFGRRLRLDDRPQSFRCQMQDVASEFSEGIRSQQTNDVLVRRAGPEGRRHPAGHDDPKRSFSVCPTQFL